MDALANRFTFGMVHLLSRGFLQFLDRWTAGRLARYGDFHRSELVLFSSAGALLGGGAFGGCLLVRDLYFDGNPLQPFP